MIIVNTDYIAGQNFIMLDMVEGSTIQSVHFGKDFMNGLKTIVGGELTSYTEMMEEARKIATGRMVANAEKLGADAIINVRYTTSSVAQAAAEVLAYGTAVRFVE